jgi:hypothetical protein
MGPAHRLLPWAGDVLTALMSGAIVLQAHHMRLPRVVQLRMLGNVAIDLVSGAIPVHRRRRRLLLEVEQEDISYLLSITY